MNIWSVVKASAKGEKNTSVVLSLALCAVAAACEKRQAVLAAQSIADRK